MTYRRIPRFAFVSMIIPCTLSSLIGVVLLFDGWRVTPAWAAHDGLPCAPYTIYLPLIVNGVSLITSTTSPAFPCPISNAGADFDVTAGTTVELDGSGSRPTGGGVLYDWTQLSGPDVTGGTGILTGVQPTFTAPSTISTLEFELRVSVGPTSNTDRVVVTVLEDRLHALFISPTGNDSNPGTRSLPMLTVNAALYRSRSLGNGADLYVASGPYTERVILTNTASIYGGFSPLTWMRNITMYQTAILGISSAGRSSAMEGDGVNNLTVDGLYITTPSELSSSGSAYGMRLSSGTNVTISNNVITVGNGGSGAPGSNGWNGGPGGPGGLGGPGACYTMAAALGGDGGWSPTGRVGGAGGKGGYGSNGSTGMAGTGGTPGGVGGPYGTPGYSGDHGMDGAAGPSGANGVGGGGPTWSGSFYSPTSGGNGANGADGDGGGGGGGGGGFHMSFPAIDGTGNGGGGGGGGGNGGMGGTGGGGGGGALGIVIWNSVNIVMRGNQITVGNGGNGGTGGSGGNGGTGGSGGPGNWVCTSSVGAGGIGGLGGPGGNGGHGGGGSGGPAFGIAQDSLSTSTRIGNAIVTGSGGAGGTSSGNSGQAGQSASFFQW